MAGDGKYYKKKNYISLRINKVLINKRVDFLVIDGNKTRSHNIMGNGTKQIVVYKLSSAGWNSNWFNGFLNNTDQNKL